jgi:hypothetical protein
VKFAPDRIDVRERQLARVRAIREQNENARVFGVDPD